MKTICLFASLPFATSKLTRPIFSPAIKNLNSKAMFYFSSEQNQPNVETQ